MVSLNKNIMLGVLPNLKTTQNFQLIKSERCGARVRGLTQQFIDKHKVAEQLFKQKIDRKRRVDIWQHQFSDVSSLCLDVSQIIAAKTHYLTFKLGDLMDLNHSNSGTYTRDRSATDDTFIRSKAFKVGELGGEPGMGGNLRNEVECYQVEDNDGNIVRRPFWIKIRDHEDCIRLLKTVFKGDDMSHSIKALRTPGSMERLCIKRNYKGTLRVGPAKRPDEDVFRNVYREDVDAVNEFAFFTFANLPKASKLRVGLPMFKSLDKQNAEVGVGYTDTVVFSKSQEVEEGLESQEMANILVEVTQYKESSLLSNKPRILYEKHVSTINNEITTCLYDAYDNTLLEKFVEYEVEKNKFSDWFTYSYGITTRIRQAVSDTTSTFISLFISKKDAYEVEIDGKNNAIAKMAIEQKTPVVDGMIGYKAAIIRATNQLCLIELFVPKTARVASSSHAAGKLRADHVVVQKMYIVSFEDDVDKKTGNPFEQYVKAIIRPVTENADLSVETSNIVAISSVYLKDSLTYKVGEEVKLKQWQFYEHMDEVCRPGIHYCLQKEEALEFHLRGGQIISSIIDATYI